ncbi:hypothetical protein KM043_001784 [Ampulex compressa]|nr:hypothetical protein KM043_001784 [Ampulex compressa]
MLLLSRLLLPLLLLLRARAHAAPKDLHRAILEFILDGTPLLFPPARLSLHLCIEEDDAVGLSRDASRMRLAHRIGRAFDEFEARFYDALEHRNLYVVDLDCSYATDVLRTANSSGMFAAPAKWLIFQERGGPGAAGDSKDGAAATIFESFAAYPDSDVLFLRGLDGAFFEITSIYRASPYRGVVYENRGNWSAAEGLRLSSHDVASRRRRNLQLTPLKSCLVMTEPDTKNHLTDYRDKQIDSITKANYPWILHLVKRMNATVSFEVTNTWGYRGENGSWSGMIGMLQRREIDLGGTGTFLVPERVGVVQYIQLYTRTGSRFIFRQPLLSSITNIFLLPFEPSVWMAIGVFLLSVLALLYLSSKWEHYRGASSRSAGYWNQMNPAKPTLSDNFLVVLGAMAQQGYSYEPYRVPARIVTLMLLVAALSLYAAYTANIVALLQSPTDSIKTLTDLLESPLKLGVFDAVYNRHYFKSFQDPIRRAIVDRKVELKGHGSSWMSVEEGVRRIKESLFAFHGEVGVVYKIVQETYREDEKCGITEIDILKVVEPLLVIQIRSPYLEIIKNGALLLHESGLKFREERLIYTEKPVCQGHTSFVTIGLTECHFALVIMIYGVILALAVFALELIWHKRYGRSATERETPEEPID